jgi:N-acyl amino acid synthase of PEP-CTERM/exosortase system
MEGLIRMSLEREIHHLCAVMEPALLRLLARLGIHFQNIGPLVDYHGRRQPCIVELHTMLTQVRSERPEVWDILTEGGQHWERLQRLLHA